MLQTQRSILQEVRDLLAIALMLMAMKSLMFGNVSARELLSRAIGQQAIAATSMATASVPALTGAEAPMPSPESFALYKEHIDYINRVLQESQQSYVPQTSGN